MTPSEVEKFFKECVLPPKGFIYCDIKREIDLARSDKPGGDFLAALGLLCYTEFMGKVVLRDRESYTKQFKAFFRLMGEDYQRLIDAREIDVYKIFRSGIVNSYFVNDCEIKMLNDNYSSGIIVKPDGKYLFIVEKYFEDFMNACQRLCDDMISDKDVYLPST